ncbi:hypothetical protein HDV62DRAFT_365995 [Trichoderma sp. SZMC 28011]
MWTFAPERVMDTKGLHGLHRRRHILIVYSVFSYDVQMFDGQRGETGWKMKYGGGNLVFTQSSYSCMGYTVAHSPRAGFYLTCIRST